MDNLLVDEIDSIVTTSFYDLRRMRSCLELRSTLLNYLLSVIYKHLENSVGWWCITSKSNLQKSSCENPRNIPQKALVTNPYFKEGIERDQWHETG